MKTAELLDALNNLSLDDKLLLYRRLRADPRVRAFAESDADYKKRSEKTISKRAARFDYAKRWRTRMERA
jgi:hypothetical protein